MNAVHAPSPEAEHVARILRGLVVADRIVVTSDMVTTYCGALGLVPGAVVAAGTGTIAMGLSSAGEVSRVDGWGYLLGDDGSGYAIGSHGLRSALRAVDGRGGSQVLASYAAKRFGNPTQMSRKIHGAQVPARVIADFSRAVAAAAIEETPTRSPSGPPQAGTWPARWCLPPPSCRGPRPRRCRGPVACSASVRCYRSRSRRRSTD